MTLSIDVDPHQASAPLDWAIGQLREAAGDLDLQVLAAGPTHPERAALQQGLGFALPDAAEALAIAPLPDGRLLVYGADRRGLIYALLELADRARHGSDLAKPCRVEPTAGVRSISRAISCELEDKPWFFDRDQWCAYLTMLATHRINRLALTFGMQYNYPYGSEFLNDVYMHFMYPFFVSVPGHAVRAGGLSDEERARNLEMLRFIVRETARRGIDFQLAIWTQRYDFDECPEANYPILGVDERRHAEYCRDALRLLLKACPEIAGLTLRVHVECGVPEGSYDFWKTYFEAVGEIEGPFALDLHAKGIDEGQIALALATGKSVSISPKYTLEHQGLPYHQAAIRQFEMPPKTSVHEKWRFSEGSRKFLRYSYGDLLKEDRQYNLLYRIWPGTQRVLLWGDPALAGGYGRSSVFSGSLGVELCEPLFFKGRMGASVPGGRNLYRDPALNTAFDWEKFAHQYRVWGRLLYAPECDPDEWRRALRSAFGAAAEPLDAALSAASRVSLLLTCAHAPSASNNSWWPEMYENMSLEEEAPNLPYGYDMFAPARYATATATDPQLFASVEEFASALLDGRPCGKYAPPTVADWFDALGETAERGLAEAERLDPPDSPDYRRLVADVRIQGAMGRFFAAKHRAATAWELWRLTYDPAAGERALAYYRAARDAWAVAAEASTLYVPDIPFGHHRWLRGRWDDRLPMIEQDIELLEQRLQAPPEAARRRVGDLLAMLESWSHDQRAHCRHEPPPPFRPGEAQRLTLACSAEAVRLHYRHVDQSEDWRQCEMTRAGEGFVAEIPADYVQEVYPLQYYFEVVERPCSRLYPGLDDTLSNEPYFLLRRA